MNSYLIIISIFFSGYLWLKYLYKYDKAEPEPLGTVIRVALLGGVISTSLAGLLNENFASFLGIDLATMEILPLAQGIPFAIFVGINEEFVKALTTILLVRKLKELDEPIDAIIYATAVGLGFAVIENFAYCLKEGKLVTLAIRSFTAMPLHIGLAAVWGYKIAEAKFIKRTPLFQEMLPSILLASVIHAVYDAIAFTTETPLVPLFVSLFIAYLLIKFAKQKLIYLLTQSPFIKTGLCIHCGTFNAPSDTICNGCGRSIKQVFYKICDSCFHRNPAYNTVCENCSEPLTGLDFTSEHTEKRFAGIKPVNSSPMQSMLEELKKKVRSLE
ncbi:MAG: PrsW family glutamic-type intramembrane protease [Spirochaetota bacterium]